MKLTLKHHFPAAHRVLDGPAQTIHGHNFAVKVEVSGQPQEDTIMDFDAMKTLFATFMNDAWAYRLILSDKDELAVDTEVWPVLEQNGAIMVPFNPTAENMAAYLAEVFGVRLSKFFEGRYRIASVTVYETPDTSARWEAPCPCSE